MYFSFLLLFCCIRRIIIITKMEKTHVMKAMVVGDSGVGKSSILLRFINNQFDEHTEPTLGAAYVAKTIPVQDKEVKFQVWDTAGQEKYKAIVPIYYKQSQIAICIYDISDRKSFATMDGWVQQIRNHGPEIKMLAIVGNKTDKTQFEEVTYTEGKQYADKNNAIFKLTSAKEGKGIIELFNTIAETYLEWNQTGKDFRDSAVVRISKNGVKLSDVGPEKVPERQRRLKCCKQA